MLKQALQALRDPHVWLLALFNFTISIVNGIISNVSHLTHTWLVFKLTKFGLVLFSHHQKLRV